MTASTGCAAGASRQAIEIEATSGVRYEALFQAFQKNPIKHAHLAIKTLADDNISQAVRAGCLHYITEKCFASIQSKLASSHKSKQAIHKLIAHTFNFKSNVRPDMRTQTLMAQRKLREILVDIDVSIAEERFEKFKISSDEQKATQYKTAFRIPEKGLAALASSLIRLVGSYLPTSDRARIARLSTATAHAYTSKAELFKGANISANNLLFCMMKKTISLVQKQEIMKLLMKGGTSVTSLCLWHLNENPDSDLTPSTPAFFKWLVASFPNLQKLDCYNSAIDDTGLQIVCTFPKLLKLKLYGCQKITENGFKVLGRLKNLESLDVGCTGIGNAGLQIVCHLERLQKLHLSFCSTITWQGFDHLANLKCIRVLDLTQTNINNNTLRTVGQLTTLTHLFIRDHCDVTSDGIAHLEPLQKLTTLSIHNAVKIEVTAIKHIAKLKNLKKLILHRLMFGPEVEQFIKLRPELLVSKTDF